MSSLKAEFGAGAAGGPVISLNNAPLAPSNLTEQDFSGAFPRQWSRNSSLDNPPINEVSNFNHPNGPELIPLAASLTGTV